MLFDRLSRTGARLKGVLSGCVSFATKEMLERTNISAGSAWRETMLRLRCLPGSNRPPNPDQEIVSSSATGARSDTSAPPCCLESGASSAEPPRSCGLSPAAAPMPLSHIQQLRPQTPCGTAWGGLPHRRRASLAPTAAAGAHPPQQQTQQTQPPDRQQQQQQQPAAGSASQQFRQQAPPPPPPPAFSVRQPGRPSHTAGLYSSPDGPVTSFGFAHGFASKYELAEQLGSGTFGIVHVAVSRKTGERQVGRGLPVGQAGRRGCGP